MNYTESYKAIDAEIKKAHSIVILRHELPDPDAIGSQVGLKELIHATYPDKELYLLGEMPESLSYIGKMDSVTQEQFDASLKIVIDCANTPRIDCPFEVNPSEVIKIDHHPDRDVYGAISFVDTHSSSTSEILCRFAFGEESTWVMTTEAANALYAGIVGDTGRFLYPSTTTVTFAMVSKLLEYNVDISGIAYHMITNPITVSRLAGYIYQNMEISENGVAATILTQQPLKEYGVLEEQTHGVISLPSTVEGVYCWVLFAEQPDGTYRVNLRSKGPIVNEIAQNHGGGGHPLASGAVVNTIEEAHQIIAELNESAKVFLSAR